MALVTMLKFVHYLTDISYVYRGSDCGFVSLGIRALVVFHDMSVKYCIAFSVNPMPSPKSNVIQIVDLEQKNETGDFFWYLLQFEVSVLEFIVEI